MDLTYDNCSISIFFSDPTSLLEITSFKDLSNMAENARFKSDIKLIQNSDIIHIHKLMCHDSSQKGSGLQLMHDALLAIKALPQFKKDIIVTLTASPLDQEGRLTTRRKFDSLKEAEASLMRYYSKAGFIEVYSMPGTMYGHIDEILSRTQSLLSGVPVPYQSPKTPKTPKSIGSFSDGESPGFAFSDNESSGGNRKRKSRSYKKKNNKRSIRR